MDLRLKSKEIAYFGKQMCLKISYNNYLLQTYKNVGFEAYKIFSLIILMAKNI